MLPNILQCILLFAERQEFVYTFRGCLLNGPREHCTQTLYKNIAKQLFRRPDVIIRSGGVCFCRDNLCNTHPWDMIYNAPHKGNITSSELDVTSSRATNKSLSTTSTYIRGNEGVDNQYKNGLISHAPTNLMTRSKRADSGDLTTESSSKSDVDGHSVIWAVRLLFGILVYFLI